MTSEKQSLEKEQSQKTDELSLAVVVGEMSADKHVSRLLKQVSDSMPTLKIWGVGGNKMQSAGVELLANIETFSTFGIFEVVKSLPFFARLRSRLLEEIGKRKPKALMLVDFGGFNIGLATKVHKQYPDLPIIYFISPQVWGSRPWRLNPIADAVKKMLVIFPFEEAIYRSRGIEAYFVGHPLMEGLPKPDSLCGRQEFAQKHKLDANRSIVGIFPGSRKMEISFLMPIIVDAVEWLHKLRPEIQFVLSRGNETLGKAIDTQISRLKRNNLLEQGVLRFVDAQDNYELMKNSDILWTKSGTTTLEAALYAKPMLIFYRGSWASYPLFMLFKTIKRVGLPNLISGKGLVPELIQLDCRAEQLVKYTVDWLDVPGLRQEVSQELSLIAAKLGHGDFVKTACDQIMETLKCKP